MFFFLVMPAGPHVKSLHSMTMTQRIKKPTTRMPMTSTLCGSCAGFSSGFRADVGSLLCAANSSQPGGCQFEVFGIAPLAPVVMTVGRAPGRAAPARCTGAAPLAALGKTPSGKCLECVLGSDRSTAVPRAARSAPAPGPSRGISSPPPLLFSISRMICEADGRLGSGDTANLPGQLLLIECTLRAAPTKALDAEALVDIGHMLRIPTAAARALLMGASYLLDSRRGLCERRLKILR